MQLYFTQKFSILILHTLATLVPEQQYIPSFITIVQATAAVQMATMSSVATAANVQQNDSVAITRNAMKVVNENDFEEILSQKLTDESTATTEKRKRKKLLSRKRRYLLFPEGSSFQLVYDAIYAVVDHTNYLILGITVALAWELPSKPQSEVIDEIAERIKDGRLNLRRNDTVGKITYVDTKSSKKKNLLKIQPVTQKLNYINLANLKTFGKLRPNYNYYYKNHKVEPLFRPPMNTKYFYNYRPRPSNKIYYSPQEHAKYPYGNRNVYGYKRKGDWRRKDNYYYSPKVNPFNKWTKKPQYMVATPNVKYPWWNLASRLSNSLRRKSPLPLATSSSSLASPMITETRRIDNNNYSYSKSQQQHKQQQQQQQKKQNHQTASGYYQSTAAARKHRIYPVFGKRSIPDEHNPHAPLNSINSTNSATHNQQQQQQQQHHHHRQRRSGITGPELTNMERIHIRHHRSTRQTLYEKIEKYLDKLGIRHSHHCVLRALCETGQKSIERTPGTFVGELMRAVFTLPEALDGDLHTHRIQYKDQRYDAAAAANAIEGGDCATRYQLCEHSLWKSQFVA